MYINIYRERERDREREREREFPDHHPDLQSPNP